MSGLEAGVIITPHDEGMCFNRGSDCIAVTERETEFYLKSEADKVIAELRADYKEACDRLQTANLIKNEQRAKADKLLSCLKYLVMRDLIKDCPPKKVAIEIMKEYDNGLG